MKSERACIYRIVGAEALYGPVAGVRTITGQRWQGHADMGTVNAGPRALGSKALRHHLDMGFTPVGRDSEGPL